MFNKKISLLVLPFMVMNTLQATDTFSNDPFGDEIFKEMYQMQREMGKVFERMQQRMDQRTQQWNVPAMIRSNVKMPGQSSLADKGTYYEYNTQVREGQDKQVNVSIEDGMLHFKATIEQNKETNQSRQHYMSMIQRSETLPEDADPGTLKSEYKNGFLILTLQKKKVHAKLLKKAKEPVQETKKPDKQEENENNRTKMKVPNSSTTI